VGPTRGAVLIMRVLAASFPDDASARAARDHLVDAFRLDDGQISVEALAPEERRRDAAVLAGRFHEETVVAARAVVERFGGTLVVDVDDRGANA